MDTDREKLTLSPPDAAALDAVLDGSSEAAVGSADDHRQRKARVEAWLGVLGAAPVPEMRGDLAARTLAAVQNDRMYVGPATGSSSVGGEEARSKAWARWRWRAAVIGSMGVAAALLLAVALQGLSAVKNAQARTACAGNLHNMGAAFNAYANSAGGDLPMLAMPANRNWLYGNSEDCARNNAANLLPLVNGYMQMKQLYCAGASMPDSAAMEKGRRELRPEITYSYRNLYGPEKPRWDRANVTIILADKNPVIPNFETGSDRRNSTNHGGKGNYILRADASVTWEISPDVGPDHDNIWTIGSGKDRHTRYSGTEQPATVKDVFVCP
jgi:hypothetical protein